MSAVASQLFRVALVAPATYLKFIRNATAALINLVFFARGEAGASLLSGNMSVTSNSVLVAIALYKSQSRVAHTLAYSRNADFEDLSSIWFAATTPYGDTLTPTASIIGLYQGRGILKVLPLSPTGFTPV